MKTLSWRLAVGLGIAALLGVAAVEAQELHQARVPFAFEVAGQRMEAGTYRAIIDTLGALTIANVDNHQNVYLMPLPRTPADTDKSSLTFRCYSGQCFLSTLQFGPSGRVYGIYKTKHEKELAAARKPETVLVAMR